MRPADPPAVRPAVIVVTGLPGTGKSTLADRLARSVRVPSFSGDWLLGAIAPSGILNEVDRDTTRAIHDRLLGALLTRQVMLGQSAILDCVATEESLQQWAATAHSHGAFLRIIECICSDVSEHRARVERRVRNVPGWHEIDWAHVERMRRETAPLRTERLTLDAIDPLERNLDVALAYLGEPID